MAVTYTHATVEEQCFLCGPCRGYIRSRVESEFIWVEWIGASWLASQWVRGLLQFSPSELLLLEAGSWGMGTVRQPRVRGTSAFGSHYQATTDEDTDWKGLVRAVVNCRVCELTIVLQLLVVTICKWSINPVTNPNPVYSHSTTPIPSSERMLHKDYNRKCSVGK
jgi:hypothetical protein